MEYSHHETHDIFFRLITKNKLKELYRRARRKSDILQKDINVLLTNKNTKTKVVVDNNCDIFINFLNMNDEQIGHMSFHMEPKNNKISEYSRKYGRLHFTNDNKPTNRVTLKINKNNDEASFSISYKVSYKLRKEVEDAVKATLSVLNGYFNISNPKTLGKYNKTYSDNCAEKIIRAMSKQKWPMQNTRKAHRKY
jgi:hypothetical protein